MDITIDRKSNDQLHTAVSSMRGRRFTMEDKHIIDLSFLNNYHLFAVFDGHGGENVANYCQIHFKRYLANALQGVNFDDDNELRHQLEECFKAIDRAIFDEYKIYNDTDKQEESGTTANVAIVTSNKIIVANCGDSRCVLGTNGSTIPMSNDHKPTQKEEKRRIKEAGGIVILGRVNGDLAVSRALGDLTYKNKEKDESMELVSCIPDVSIQPRDPQDEVLLLACDGVWDVMKSHEVVKSFTDRYRQGEKDIGIICKEIITECYDKGSGDNMTLIGIKFPALDNPYVPPVESKKDEEEKKVDQNQQTIELEQTITNEPEQKEQQLPPSSSIQQPSSSSSPPPLTTSIEQQKSTVNNEPTNPKSGFFNLNIFKKKKNP